MQNAQKRDACRDAQFWFRKDITTQVSPPAANECCKTGSKNNCNIDEPMTVNQIINGKVSFTDLSHHLFNTVSMESY